MDQLETVEARRGWTPGRSAIWWGTLLAAVGVAWHVLGLLGSAVYPPFGGNLAVGLPGPLLVVCGGTTLLVGLFRRR